MWGFFYALQLSNAGLEFVCRGFMAKEINYTNETKKIKTP